MWRRGSYRSGAGRGGGQQRKPTELRVRSHHVKAETGGPKSAKQIRGAKRTKGQQCLQENEQHVRSPKPQRAVHTGLCESTR